MRKNPFPTLAAAALLALNLSSCAALMRYKCNKEFAAKKGMDDAANARTAMPGRLEGAKCEGEYSSSDFSKDYNFGFQQKKNEICAPASAAGWGRVDGEAGAAAKPQKARLGMCEDNRLFTLYDQEFRKAFCAPARATKLGTERAGSWQPADFETAFHDCPGQKPLRAAYASAYRDALAANCGADKIRQAGVEEANARRAPDAARARLQLCPAESRAELLAAFEKSFAERKAALEKEDAERAVAAAAAARQAKVDEFLRATATASFPYQLRSYVSRCSVSGDRSFVAVEVENAYPEQVLIQGNWRLSYYNNDFGKITEDRTQEAILLTGKNRKSFQKLTLPKEASFCRAEFLGQTM